MTEHKFTGEEVIKALEYHSDPLKPCVYKCVYGDQRYCGSKMAKDALDLINRQKAEVAFWMDAAANAKKEAIKEFAERLKSELEAMQRVSDGKVVFSVSVERIESVVKERLEGG